MAFTWKEILLFIASILMIVIVLITDSKEDSASAFSGKKSELFANQRVRGFDLVMTWLSFGIAVLFLVFAVLAVALD